VPKKKVELVPALITDRADPGWAASVLSAMKAARPSDAARQEYRALLDQMPEVWKKTGDLARRARLSLSERFERFPRWHEEIKHATAELQRDLGHDTASPIERVLIEQIVICYIDLHSMEVIYSQQIKDNVSFSQMQSWDEVLDKRNTRFLRSVETLARVRRLLSRPQVNINLPGGQQVNVAGDVKA
jgi:hypothetical protein